MASFISGIFRTPRSNASRPREPSPKDDLSPESVLSSPVTASALVRNGQSSSLKKLKRKRVSTDTASPDLGHDAGQDNDAPEPKGVRSRTTPPKKIAVSRETASRDGPTKAVAHDDAAPDATDATPSKSERTGPAKQKTRDIPKSPREELWTIEAIQKHRWVDGSIELQIKWDTGEITWEPEAFIQEDAPAVLFTYWASKGGHPPHPSDPELFHIFAIRQAKPRAQKLLIEWVGYKEKTWEPKSMVEEVAPEMLRDFEDRQSRIRKRRRRN